MVSLEHFKGRMLSVKECKSNARDRTIEPDLLRLFYCTAQPLRGGPDPALAKPLLILQSGFLHCDEMPNHFAKCRDVVFRFGGFAAASKMQFGKVAAQHDQRHLVRIANGISAGVKRDRSLADADEGRVVLLHDHRELG